MLIGATTSPSAADPAPARVENRRINSEALGKSIDFNVWLQAGYECSSPRLIDN